MQLTQKEFAKKKLSADHYAEAVRELRVSGYTILERVLAVDLVATLHSAFIVQLEGKYPRDRGQPGTTPARWSGVASRNTFFGPGGVGERPGSWRC